MDKRTQELAEQAGFIFWNDESWGPGPGHIDWACNYDKEFEKLDQLLRQEYQKSVNTEPLTQALKSWVINIEEDSETGEGILTLPDELLDQMSWKEGDTLVFKDNPDGSFTLSKKQEIELVMVDTIVTYRMRYVVEVPKGQAECALETVAMDDAKEFSQECLGEQIASYRVVTEVEALEMCDKDNECYVNWTDELKKKNFFTSLEDQNQN
jgi:bifunctional DNA-binding transcriptional regulator/antitoxin component of YhaV-PrlF toxin-antitoxin module